MYVRMSDNNRSNFYQYLEITDDISYHNNAFITQNNVIKKLDSIQYRTIVGNGGA